MKTTLKIGILLVALILAVGGIMIYAKTKVNPPTTPEQIDVYGADLAQCEKNLKGVYGNAAIDSTFHTTIDRINIYCQEGKISEREADRELDVTVGIYMPKYLRRCFGKFEYSVWYEADHARMLSEIAELRKIRHNDYTDVIKGSTADSLNTIVEIINKYRQARQVSKSTGFKSVDNAQSVISQARQFANDPYLSNCTDLRNELNAVRGKIGQSHYRYISREVEKLSQYQLYDSLGYNKVVVPHVDAVVNEYDNKAAALYGSKENVESLWSRARNYYNQATSYYDRQYQYKKNP